MWTWLRSKAEAVKNECTLCIRPYAALPRADPGHGLDNSSSSSSTSALLAACMRAPGSVALRKWE